MENGDIVEKVTATAAEARYEWVDSESGISLLYGLIVPGRTYLKPNLRNVHTYIPFSIADYLRSEPINLVNSLIRTITVSL